MGEISMEKQMGAGEELKGGVVKSGIEGLDEILDGGFDPGNVTLLAGPPGSGKSIMSAQFIYNGVVRYGETGIYVNFSESKSDFMRNMARLGMDFSRLEEEGRFKFIDAYNIFSKRSLDLIVSHILDEITTFRIRRMVLDPINAITALMDKEELRAFVTTTILGICKVNNVTCMLVSNQHQGMVDEKLAELAFMCDVVIRLETKMVGDVVERFLVVEKARGKRNIVSRTEYLITDSGIVVFTLPSRPLAKERWLEESVGIGHVEFDEKVLMGGVKRGTVTLISGPGGVGKSVLLVEFAASGVLRGERVLYVTFRDLKGVEKAFSGRGYNIEELKRTGLKLIEFQPFKVTPGMMLVTLKKVLDDFQPSRVVVEEVASLRWLPREEYCRLINKMVSLFKSYNVTAMISSGIDTNVMEADEFMAADNVIHIWRERKGGEAVRKISVIKMKGVHDRRIRELVYGEGEIKVF